jgi:hypothetical protein
LGSGWAIVEMPARVDTDRAANHGATCKRRRMGEPGRGRPSRPIGYEAGHALRARAQRNTSAIPALLRFLSPTRLPQIVAQNRPSVTRIKTPDKRLQLRLRRTLIARNDFGQLLAAWTSSRVGCATAAPVVLERIWNAAVATNGESNGPGKRRIGQHKPNRRTTATNGQCRRSTATPAPRDRICAWPEFDRLFCSGGGAVGAGGR